MISYKITTDSIVNQKTDSYIFMISKDALTDETVWNSTSEMFQKFIAEYIPDFKTIVKKQKFIGKIGQVCMIPIRIGDQLVHCIFTGVTKGDSIENYRRGLGHAIKTAANCGHISVALQVIPAKAETLFGAEKLSQGYNLGTNADKGDNGKCGEGTCADDEGKDKQGKCGNGKCGS